MKTEIGARTREPWTIIEDDDDFVLASWQQICRVRTLPRLSER